ARNQNAKYYAKAHTITHPLNKPTAKQRKFERAVDRAFVNAEKQVDAVLAESHKAISERIYELNSLPVTILPVTGASVIGPVMKLRTDTLNHIGCDGLVVPVLDEKGVPDKNRAVCTKCGTEINLDSRDSQVSWNHWSGRKGKRWTLFGKEGDNGPGP